MAVGSSGAGSKFVPYLEPGHYVGVEISGSRLEQGRRLMDEAGIATRQLRNLSRQ